MAHGINHRAWRRLRAQILAANPICALCGGPGADSVDHIIPRSLGGQLLDPDNCRPCHLTCNIRRGNGTRALGKRATNPTSRVW